MGALDTVLGALYDADLEVRAAARDAAAEAAAAAIEVLDAAGIAVTRRLSPEEMPPWHVALEVADEVGAAVVVAGTNESVDAPPGSLGREARALAHRGSLPLLLVPPAADPPAGAAPAVFAFDGSSPASHALDVAGMLLTPRPAVVATAWETASYAVGVALLAVPAGVAQHGAQSLDAASCSAAAATAGEGATSLAAAGWTSDPLAVEARRNPATAIIGLAAERDAALIVTGTRGRARLSAALLGSTAEALIRHAGRPVLLVAPQKAGR
jgi:nucleotide-binding universal stress UspA family protein